MTDPVLTVYTQPDCRPCKRVIDKLEESGLDFEVVDLSENDEARSYLVNVLGVRSTPVILTDDDVIVGYQPDLLQDLIHDYVHEESEDA